MSMLRAMMFSACEDCVFGTSSAGDRGHGCAHVGRQIGGSLSDEFNEAFGEEIAYEVIVERAGIGKTKFGALRTAPFCILCANTSLTGQSIS